MVHGGLPLNLIQGKHQEDTIRIPNHLEINSSCSTLSPQRNKHFEFSICIWVPITIWSCKANISQ